MASGVGALMRIFRSWCLVKVCVCLVVLFLVEWRMVFGCSSERRFETMRDVGNRHSLPTQLSYLAVTLGNVCLSGLPFTPGIRISIYLLERRMDDYVDIPRALIITTRRLHYTARSYGMGSHLLDGVHALYLGLRVFVFQYFVDESESPS